MLNELKVICPKCEQQFSRGTLAGHVVKCGLPPIPAPVPTSTSFPTSLPPPLALDFLDGTSIPTVMQCPNRNNVYHTCTSYCREQFASNTQRTTTTNTTTSQNSTGCPNASNPYHKCSYYCTQTYGVSSSDFVPAPLLATTKKNL